MRYCCKEELGPLTPCVGVSQARLAMRERAAGAVSMSETLADPFVRGRISP